MASGGNCVSQSKGPYLRSINASGGTAHPTLEGAAAGGMTVSGLLTVMRLHEQAVEAHADNKPKPPARGLLKDKTALKSKIREDRKAPLSKLNSIRNEQNRRAGTYSLDNMAS
jgi:hypothetical protein